MPRDLEAEHETLSGLAPLSRESRNKSPPSDPNLAGPDDQLSRSPEALDAEMVLRDSFGQSRFHRDMRQEARRDELNPFVQTLNPSHVESCVVVEDNAFPENERCSRQKVRSILFSTLRSLSQSNVPLAPRFVCTLRFAAARDHLHTHSIPSSLR